jgi:uncharacterized membrane protein YjjP (DUF1212 family)
MMSREEFDSVLNIAAQAAYALAVAGADKERCAQAAIAVAEASLAAYEKMGGQRPAPSIVDRAA